MRLVAVLVALVVGLTVAWAAPKKSAPTVAQQLEPYIGRLVYSPDTPPASVDELPGFLAANAVDENAYDIIKGPPWPMHLVAVLAKDPGTKSVQLVFADKADKKLATMHAVPVKPNRKLVIAASEANIAAGFAANKTYVVRLMVGKTVLARAELTLKD